MVTLGICAYPLIRYSVGVLIPVISVANIFPLLATKEVFLRSEFTKFSLAGVIIIFSVIALIYPGLTVSMLTNFCPLNSWPAPKLMPLLVIFNCE